MTLILHGSMVPLPALQLDHIKIIHWEPVKVVILYFKVTPVIITLDKLEIPKGTFANSEDILKHFIRVYIVCKET